MTDTADRLNQLTPAQLRVYWLVCGGLSSREIARRLKLSLRTVENHRTHICRRLGLSGPHALLQHALRNKRK